MRKVQLLLVCLMLSVAAFAADKVIKLPKPNLNRTGAVMKALSERHSTREYASKSLSLSDLSDLLWAANGINRKESGMRTAPSALNKQDVAIIMGSITGAAGGVIRDVFINEIPLIFRKEIYAMACVVGGIAYWLCDVAGLESYACQLIGGLAVFLTRILAVKYHICLPILKGSEEPEE